MVWMAQELELTVEVLESMVSMAPVLAMVFV